VEEPIRIAVSIDVLHERLELAIADLPGGNGPPRDDMLEEQTVAFDRIEDTTAAISICFRRCLQQPEAAEPRDV
jgi:hypothetical protein